MPRTTLESLQAELSVNSPVTQGRTTLDSLKAEFPQPDIDQTEINEEPGFLATTTAALHGGLVNLETSALRLPDSISRVVGGAGDSLDAMGLPDALNIARPLSGIANIFAKGVDIGDYHAAGFSDLADKADYGLEFLNEQVPAYGNVVQKGQDIQAAQDDLFKGEFGKLGDVITDPAAISSTIAQALPSLAAAVFSGGSIPLMAAMEGQEQMSNIARHERDTGEHIRDIDAATAIIIQAGLGGLLEKIGFDAMFKRFPALNNMMAKAGIGGFGEMSTEVLQAGVGNAAKNLTYGDVNDSYTDGMLQGAIGGLGLGTTGGAASHLANRNNPIDSVNDLAPAAQIKPIDPIVPVAQEGENNTLADIMGLSGMDMLQDLLLNEQYVPSALNEDGSTNIINPDIADIFQAQAQQSQAPNQAPQQPVVLDPAPDTTGLADEGVLAGKGENITNENNDIQNKNIVQSKNYSNSKLKRPEYRDAIESMMGDIDRSNAPELIKTSERDGGIDQDTYRRTPSLNPAWFQEMAANENITTDQVKATVRKALDGGQNLGVRQQRIIDGLIDTVEGERASPQNVEEAQNKRIDMNQVRKGFSPVENFDETEIDNLSGKMFEEESYDPSFDDNARTIYELGERAIQLDQGAAEAILESSRDDQAVATELWSLIYEREQQESVAGNEGQQEEGGQAETITRSEGLDGQTSFLEDAGQQQAIADKQREIDERLNGKEDIAPESAGDLFDQNRSKQTDITTQVDSNSNENQQVIAEKRKHEVQNKDLATTNILVSENKVSRNDQINKPNENNNIEEDGASIDAADQIESKPEQEDIDNYIYGEKITSENAQNNAEKINTIIRGEGDIYTETETSGYNSNYILVAKNEDDFLNDRNITKIRISDHAPSRSAGFRHGFNDYEINDLKDVPDVLSQIYDKYGVENTPLLSQIEIKKKENLRKRNDIEKDRVKILSEKQDESEAALLWGKRNMPVESNGVEDIDRKMEQKKAGKYGEINEYSGKRRKSLTRKRGRLISSIEDAYHAKSNASPTVVSQETELSSNPLQLKGFTQEESDQIYREAKGSIKDFQSYLRGRFTGDKRKSISDQHEAIWNDAHKVDNDSTTIDKDSVKFSKGQEGSRSTVDQVKSEITKKYKGVQRLINNGEIEVVQSLKDLPEALRKQVDDDGNTQGLFDGVKSYLVADNLGENVQSTLLHEMSHRMNKLNPELKDQLIGKQGEFAKIFNDIKSGSRKGFDSAFYEKAISRVPEDTKESDVIEEAMAYTLSEFNAGNNIPAKLKRWAKEFMAHVRRALRKAGIKFQLQPADLQILVKQSMNEDAAEQIFNSEPVKFSKAEEDTESGQTVFIKGGEVMSNHPSLEKKSALNKFLRSQFSSKGGLNEEAFRSKINMENDKNFGGSVFMGLSADLMRSAKKAYKKSYHKLSASQKDEMLNYLSGKGSSVPDGMKPVLDNMRTALDGRSSELQQTIVDNIKYRLEALKGDEKANNKKYIEAVIAGKDVSGFENVDAFIKGKVATFLTIEGNIGTYLNRSYQAFNDPKWEKSVRKNAAIMGPARDFISSQIQEREGLTGKSLADRVEGEIDSILSKAAQKQDMLSFLSTQQLGQKNNGIFKKKKEVPVQIRELLGEYKDPIANFSNSYAKMTHLVANHKFLKRIRDEGTGSFLSTKASGSMSEQVMAFDPSSMSPLQGLYGTKELVDEISQITEPKALGNMLKLVLRFNGAIKAGKVIISPTTQFRNFESASLFAVMNGHFNFKHAYKAAKAIKQDIQKKDNGLRDYLQKMTKLGVLHDNPNAGELMDNLNDFSGIEGSEGGIVKRGYKKTGRLITDVYQASDDFWKIIGFENEMASLRKNRKGVKESELEAIAAERIRSGYPTYSLVPKAIRTLRKIPLIGTFTSFPWEIIRTSKNQFNILAEDAAYAKENGGSYAPVYRRGLGMLTATVAVDLIAQYLMEAAGVDDEDDEAIHNISPEWQRNSTFWYTGVDDDGRIMYVDASFIDPYAMLKKSVKALFNGNNVSAKDKLVDSAKEILEPFLGWEIGTGTIAELVFNKRLSGAPIYNEEDPDAWKVAGKYAINSLAPGIYGNITRMIKAHAGDVSRSGKEYTMADEWLAFVGIRQSTLNVPTSFRYKISEMNRRKSAASSILGYKLSGQNSVTDDDIKRAFNNMVQARKEIFDETYQTILLAKKMGESDAVIKKLLSVNGFAKRDIPGIMKGETPKWRVSSRFLRSAQENAKITSSERRKPIIVREMRDRVRLVRELSRTQ